MNIQMETYRSEMNFEDVDAAGYDNEIDMLAVTVPMLEAGASDGSICGLTPAMMDDLRGMLIY